MRQFLHIVLLGIFCYRVMAQENIELNNLPDINFIPSVKTVFYKLGATNIPLKIQQYGSRDNIVFINLHDDEFTSVEAARKILEKEGGLLIEVENNQQRLIRFSQGNVHYTIDPNSIFSTEGITRSLNRFGKTSPTAVKEAEKFGIRLLQMIPVNTQCVIALHNNTPGNYSVQDYTSKNKKGGDATKVFVNPEEDADDFFLTTDPELYSHLSRQEYNTILQDNLNCTDDGSLSVYCGKNNIRYINCETEHGKFEKYYKMILAISSSPVLLSPK